MKLLHAILSNASGPSGRRFAASFILAFENLPSGLEIVADWWILEILCCNNVYLFRYFLNPFSCFQQFNVYEIGLLRTTVQWCACSTIKYASCIHFLRPQLLERQQNFDPVTRTADGGLQRRSELVFIWACLKITQKAPLDRHYTKGLLMVQELVPSKLSREVCHSAFSRTNFELWWHLRRMR